MLEMKKTGEIRNISSEYKEEGHAGQPVEDG
jgi:hypothetical protein